MNRLIHIGIKNKIARLEKQEEYYICGNDDFKIVFDFDDDWDEYGIKTARFSYQGKYHDVLFEGNECPVPVIVGTMYVDVGVFAGNLCSSTPVQIRTKESILCKGGMPDAPEPNVYDQILKSCNETKAIAEEVKRQADEGEFDGKDGVDGKDGHTPVRGEDYWTPEDVAEIKGYVDEAILGGAW